VEVAVAALSHGGVIDIGIDLETAGFLAVTGTPATHALLAAHATVSDYAQWSALVFFGCIQINGGATVKDFTEFIAYNKHCSLRRSGGTCLKCGQSAVHILSFNTYMAGAVQESMKASLACPARTNLKGQFCF